MKIAGYITGEKLHRGKNFTVYRAKKENETASCILKLLEKKTARSSNVINELDHEYAFLEQVDSVYVIKAIDRIEDNEYAGIVLEDINGKPVKEEIKKRLPIERFIELAIRIATGLKAIHERNIIHKDINPSNIVCDSQTGGLKIIDFSIATKFDIKISSPGNPEMLQGTLPYVSPEQTGRMNRGVDRRSDLYSLGVTFYEMLTGKLPFEQRDPMELVYAHLACNPVPPHLVVEEIPPVISKILLKLLAKNPEDRYQTVEGLIHDLENAASSNFNDFTLGEKDFTGKLQIPGKIYGREKEIEQLLGVYREVSGGGKKIIMVAGYPGAGKTALVNEIHKSITKDRGYFTGGKFDQLQRTIPYSAFIQALDQYCQLLLTEKQEILARSKEHILQAVGALGKVLTDIIPLLEPVIGKQPEVPEVGGDEAKKRFNYVFQRFMRACTMEHPLVMFIDDLQWADLASLNLLQVLMEDGQNRCLLFIGAYRENEVTPLHPLMMTLEAVQKQDIGIHTIPVKNLTPGNVREWLQDALKTRDDTDMQDVDTLSGLIYQKTRGNAFFTIQFLENLYRENLLRFDFTRARWTWDIHAIEKRNITDNVVDLLVRKIQTMPSELQEVLKLAACIGNVFDLHTLSIISGKEKKEHEKTLETALAHQLVYFLGDENYKFVHDRIHQAAYTLIAGKDKKTLHLKIGRLLLGTFGTPGTSTISKDVERHIFDIVNHFDTGIELVENELEKIELARLNLEAGQIARKSAAYKTGADYVLRAVRLLPPGCWEKQYDLTLAVYNEAVRTYYLCGNFEDTDHFIDGVLTYARDISHTSVAYEYRLLSLLARNQPHRAVETMLNLFKRFGVDIPGTPNRSETNRILDKTQALLERKEMGSLENLPAMSDPEKKLVLRLFYVGAVAFLFAANELWPYVIGTMTGVILEFGLIAETPYILACYGIIRILMGDIPGAYRLGENAMDLLERGTGNEAIKVRSVPLVCFYIYGQKQHFKKVCKLLAEYYPYALEAGDFEYAGYNLAHYSLCLSRTGTELGIVHEKAQANRDTVIQLKQPLAIPPLLIEIAYSANLLGQTPDPAVLHLEDIFRDMDPGTEKIYRWQLDIKQIILAYLFEEYTPIIDCIKAVEENLKFLTVPLTYIVSDCHFYISLSYLRLHTGTPAEHDKSGYLDKAIEKINIMRQWAEFGPVNFLHKYYLMQAELLRVTGRDHEAAEYYDKAIEKAFENEYINEAALANELAAKFYMRQNRHKLAAVYFQEARDCYRKWGAIAKVKHLEENYPRYLGMGIPGVKLTAATISSSSTDTTDEFLDVKSIIKASQTLSGEVHLKNLLEKMMHILIENAGAQRGLFMENTGNRLLLRAEGAKDGVTAILGALPAAGSGKVPLSVVNYVARVRKKLVFDNLTGDPNYYNDPYIQENRPRSVVCFPILRHGELSAVIYLENNLVEGAFTPARVEVLNTLSAQIAISMENARIYRDLEELNESLEQKVRERTLQLEEMDKAKSRFFANISHEFRTPLTLIMGPLERRLSAGGDNRDLRETQMMLRNSRCLLDLVNQLLELARLDSGKMKLEAALQDIVPFVENIVMCFESLAAQNKVELIFHKQEENITVYFDPEKLEKIVTNLLSNAFNYTPAGGKITVSVRVPGVDDRFPAGGVEISVRDTGTGIPRDQLPYIFDRFYRGEGGHEYKGKGSGIGLALTKELVELHHGEIEAQSSCRDDDTRGSEFLLRLPMGEGHLEPGEIVTIKSFDQTFSKGGRQPHPIKPPAGPPEAIDRSSETQEPGEIEEAAAAIDVEKEAQDLVLVVEDNADVRAYIKSSLEPQFRVLEAVDGKQGIRRAKDIIPDLIVSDVMMPGVDGYELCRTLKKDVLTCHIPVILLTARVSEESVLRGLESGADDYITKPFNTVILAVRVKNLVDLRRRLQLENKNRMAFQPWEINVSPLDDEFYKKLQDMMEAHLSDPDFGVEALCRELDMSQATLYRKIQAMTGKSPTLFLRSFRIKRAAQLLQAGAGSVSEVAGRVGFVDRSYFARCFKEQFHYLPSDVQASGVSDENKQKLLPGVQGGPAARGAYKGFLEKNPPGGRRQETILLVEDNEDARDYIRGSLETDYHMVEAVDGIEGLARAMEIIPDLVISDIMMPGMDGYELCRVLKQDVRSSHIPIVLLTARASEESRIKGLETGADDYITKPFNTQILRARIKNLIQLRSHLQDKRNREMTLLPVKISEPGIHREFMKELNTVIEQNLDDPEFNVEQLAKKLYMSSATLYRKIQALSGEIPSAYIRSYRLRRAAQLFKENPGSVTEVAFEVGFNSRTYFTKCFKEQFHRLPSVYMAAEAE